MTFPLLVAALATGITGIAIGSNPMILTASLILTGAYLAAVNRRRS